MAEARSETSLGGHPADPLPQHFRNQVVSCRSVEARWGWQEGDVVFDQSVIMFGRGEQD